MLNSLQLGVGWGQEKKAGNKVSFKKGVSRVNIALALNPLEWL